MAQPIRQNTSPSQVQPDLLRQANLDGSSRNSVAALPGVPLTALAENPSTPEGRVARQLLALNARLDAMAVELQQVDRKWGKQFAGFQETASITAEAVIGFDSELQAQQANLASFGAIFSSQTGSINTRSNLLTVTVDTVVHEFAAYRSTMQKKFARLYAGLGLLTLGLLATIAFIATKL